METSGGAAQPLSNVSLAQSLPYPTQRAGRGPGRGVHRPGARCRRRVAWPTFGAFATGQVIRMGGARPLPPLDSHYAIALYAALIEAGILPEDELETYGSDETCRCRRWLPTRPAWRSAAARWVTGCLCPSASALRSSGRSPSRSSTACSPTASSTRDRCGKRRCPPATGSSTT